MSLAEIKTQSVSYRRHRRRDRVYRADRLHIIGATSFFGTAPIAVAVWLFILPFAFGIVLREELRK